MLRVLESPLVGLLCKHSHSHPHKPLSTGTGPSRQVSNNVPRALTYPLQKTQCCYLCSLSALPNRSPSLPHPQALKYTHH